MLNHARHALDALETGATASRAQVDLFAPPPASADNSPGPLESALNAIQPDALTPREALDALYRLKKLADREQLHQPDPRSSATTISETAP